MSTASGSSAKISRSQKILLGVLFSTLTSLWMPSFLSIGEVPPPPSELATQRRPRPLPKSSERKETSPAPAKVVCDLEATLAVDPFQVPKVMTHPVALATTLPPIEQEKQQTAALSVEKRRESLAKVLSQRVSLIVETPRGPAARLGSKLVRVGDNIEGFKVEQITKDGIDLSREPIETP
jgi:hypothetical protein